MDDTAFPATDPGILPRTAALAKRLLALARIQRDLPATPADLDTAAGALLRFDPDGVLLDEQLLDAMRDAACTRLSATARRDLDAAFAQATGDLEALTGRAPTLPAIPAIASLVARAAGIEAAAAKAFGQRLVAAEQSRRADARAARDRSLHDAERRRLREWESELVGADALPALLGASRAARRCAAAGAGSRSWSSTRTRSRRCCPRWRVGRCAVPKWANRQRHGHGCRTAPSRGAPGWTAMPRISSTPAA